MVILVYYDKVRCAVCNLKFRPHYCKVCRKRDFTACPSCHKHTQFHKRELSKVGHRI